MTTTKKKRRETRGPDTVTQRVLGNLPPRQTFSRRDAIRQTKCPACKERLLLGRGRCPKCDPGSY